MYLVTAFDMRNVDYHTQDAPCVKLTSPQGHGDHWLSVEQMEQQIETGKAHASATPLVLAPGALDAVKLIKEAFPTSDERQYQYGRYGSDAEVGAVREALGISDPL